MAVEMDDELIKIGAFNLEDLEINRSGELSERQKMVLKFWAGFWLILASIDIAIFVGHLAFQIFYLRYWGAGIAISIILIILANMNIENAKPFQKDLLDNKVKTSSGKLFKLFSMARIGKSGKIWNCSIRVDEQVFSVSPAIYDVVVQNEGYRLYYAPHSRKLVNIEPL